MLETYCFAVLKIGNPRSRCWQIIPSRGCEGAFVPILFSQLLVLCGQSFVFLAWRNTTLISVFMFTWHSPCVCICLQIFCFLIRTLVTLDQGPTPFQYNLILTNCICKNPISKKGQVPRYCGLYRTSTYEFGEWQNSTHNSNLFLDIFFLISSFISLNF